MIFGQWADAPPGHADWPKGGAARQLGTVVGSKLLLIPSMRTLGTVLLAFCWPSVAVVLGSGQTCRRRGGLLYLAAVQLASCWLRRPGARPLLLARSRALRVGVHPLAVGHPPGSWAKPPGQGGAPGWTNDLGPG